MAFDFTLNLGGHERTLRLDMKAMNLVERVTGKAMLLNQEAFGETRALTAMVWAALHKLNLSPWNMPDEVLYSAKPTLDTVGDWIEEAGTIEVATAMLIAFGESMPRPEQKEGEGGVDPVPFPEGNPSAQTG